MKTKLKPQSPPPAPPPEQDDGCRMFVIDDEIIVWTFDSDEIFVYYDGEVEFVKAGTHK